MKTKQTKTKNKSNPRYKLLYDADGKVYKLFSAEETYRRLTAAVLRGWDEAERKANQRRAKQARKANP